VIGLVGARHAEFFDRFGAEVMALDAGDLRNRMRDTHDLWHVVTGYKGDLVGEASLLAFLFAQTRNPGVGFIVAVALLVGTRKLSRVWLLLLLWAAICLFYVSYCPIGYLRDIEEFVLPPVGSRR